MVSSRVLVADGSPIMTQQLQLEQERDSTVRKRTTRRSSSKQ